MKRRKPDVIRARVPEAQDSFIVVNNQVFVSVLWSFGGTVDVPLRELRKLLANTRRTVIVARQLNAAESHMFQQARGDSDVETHARLIHNEDGRWRRHR